MEDNYKEPYKEPSVCDDCEIGDGWECHYPDCDQMDI